MPIGQADLGVYRRLHAAPPLAGGRNAYFVRRLDSGGPAVGASAALGQQRRPESEWQLEQLDAAALARLLQAGSQVQVRTARAHGLLSRPGPEQSAAPEAAPQLEASAWGPSAGRGVLVGLIDTGIDLQHATFRDATGRHRVVAVWDQDAAAASGHGPLALGHYVPSAFGYGLACGSAAIEAGTCLFGDPIGHGTHVASIAAGSAPGALGVAPQADIALVRSAHFTQLADAVAFLDGLAQSRGQPLVINISVGGHYGPHDGRTPLEKYLNHMAGPGRIIVAAAGNDGDSAVHVAFELAAQPARIALEQPPCTPGASAEVDFWLPKQASVGWALELWEDGMPATELVFGGPHQTWGQGRLTTRAGQLAADAAFVQEWVPEHDLLHLGLQLIGTPTCVVQDNRRLVLRFTGRGAAIQGWVGQGHVSAAALRFGTAPERGFVTGDSQRSITVPATAPRLITVGSYTVQQTWVSQTDGVQSLQRAAVGARSLFSSLGPTGFPLSTGFKPDLMAPGSMVQAARSRDVPDGPTTLNASQMVMQGTSMAAPHVAGTIALMLAADPGLDPYDVRRLLHQTARSDAFTQTTPNAAWGFGKLDASAAVSAAESEQGGCQASPPASAWWLAGLCLLAWRRRRDAAQRRQARRQT